MYKFLIFDLDDTLLDFKSAEKNAIRDFFTYLKVSDIQQYYKAYVRINTDMWRQLEREEITREYLVNTRFQKTFKEFGKIVDGKEYAKEYRKFIGKYGIILDGADKFLEKISKDFEIYIATNGLFEIQKNRLKNSSISKYFKDVFISEKIGYLKPKREFFEYIEKNIDGFEKKKALMIGDNILADIYGAKNFGIDTVWFNYKNLIDYDNVKPTFEVKSYKELLDILYKKS